MKDQKRHNKKWCYVALIGAATVILIFYVILPIIIVGPKRIPDNNEITNRFSEFIVQPENIKGIEARTKEGYALFKYYSKAINSFDQIERQALAKGWKKTNIENSGLAFTKEDWISSKIYQYEFARVSQSQIPDLICVGYDRFLSVDRVPDLKNSNDMKVIENTTWCKFDSCVAGTL